MIMIAFLFSFRYLLTTPHTIDLEIHMGIFMVLLVIIRHVSKFLNL